MTTDDKISKEHLNSYNTCIPYVQEAIGKTEDIF